MSKTHRIDGLNRRINRLEARIKCDQSELADLKERLARMTATRDFRLADEAEKQLQMFANIRNPAISIKGM